MKLLLFICLLLPQFIQAQSDTLSIYFEKDSYNPTSSELKKLKWDSSWFKVELFAYADYLGSVSHNKVLAENRAKEIKSQLLELGFPEEKIQKTEGVGEIGAEKNSSLGEPKNRRVDIIFYREKLSQQKELTITVSDTIKKLPAETDLSSQINEAQLGDNLVLNNLLFVGGQHYITLESKPILDSLIGIMKANKNLKIAIEGHICCETTQPDGQDFGTGKYNLSEARAFYIYERLIEQGIDADRLSYKGFARTRPLYKKEKTPFEQQANRRVEIRIVEK